MSFALYMIIGSWILIDAIICINLCCNILSINDFYAETFKMAYFIEQIKAMFYDGYLFCPFSPASYNKYTSFGIVVTSVIWIITIGISLIPAIVISYILWAVYWIYIKLCIKDEDK